MTDNQLLNDKEFISKLCVTVEKRIGRKMASPRDFDYLSDMTVQVGRRISSSTLKRIWGYNRDISSTYRPYKYTLLSLIKFLGFNSFEDYLNYKESPEVESASYMGETVTTDEIMPGSIVELTWQPDRTCSLTCLNKGVFRVVHCENGRLNPGDIVKFRSITQNAPLYFNEVTRSETDEKFVYIAGQHTGIRYNIRGIITSEDDIIIS